MSDICPNCGKPILPTDTACWHCGYALPKRPKATSPAARVSRPTAATAAAEAEAPPDDYDLRALAIYGLLTLALLVALWLVMGALGRQPVLVRSAALGDGAWAAVTDADLRYTLSLPPGWQWLDLAYRDQQALLEQVLDHQPAIGRALDPLGRAAGDVEILALAANSDDLTAEEPLAYVVVGRSVALRDVEPPTALAALAVSAEGGLSVSAPALDSHLAGQPQARFDSYDGAAGTKCRHLFLADSGVAGYLVAACAPQADYGTLRPALGDILDSFQLLQR